MIARLVGYLLAGAAATITDPDVKPHAIAYLQCHAAPPGLVDTMENVHAAVRAFGRALVPPIEDLAVETRYYENDGRYWVEIGTRATGWAHIVAHAPTFEEPCRFALLLTQYAAYRTIRGDHVGDTYTPLPDDVWEKDQQHAGDHPICATSLVTIGGQNERQDCSRG